MSKENNILLLDPFYGGSHKQLSDLLCRNIVGCDRFVLSGKKWHWRARTAALVFSQMVPQSAKYRVLFTSSVLNLPELVALRPDLSRLKKIVYFHENQLVYPVRKHQDRDFQYGYNQILSCLVADVIVFNSKYNMESFLSSINSFLKLMPDYRPKDLANTLRPKCQVISFPLEIPDFVKSHEDSSRTGISLSKIANLVDTHTTEMCDPEDEDKVAVQTKLKCCDTLVIQTESQCSYSASFQDDQANSSLLCRCIEGESVFNRTSHPDKEINRTYIDITCHPDTESDVTYCPDIHFERTYPSDKDINCLPDLCIKRSCPLELNINQTSPLDKEINKICVQDTDINSACHSDTEINTKECLSTKNLKFEVVSYVKQEYIADSKTLTGEKDQTESHWDGSNICRIEYNSHAPEMNFENSDTTEIPPCFFQPEKGSFMHPFHIVWPHRWEHDKGPETLFKVMFQLHDKGLDFHLSVIGEQYSEVPAIFEEARLKLSAHIRTWGYQEKKSDYYQVLQQADCVVSTALHEFFGVAMLEAVYFKCYPLCPNRLVYPEIFPKSYLYNTPNQLYKRLREFCRRPHLARSHIIQIDVEKYMWKTLQSEFENLLNK